MGVTRHNINFAGINALEKEIVIYSGTADEMAARDVEAVTVPGRNGVLHLDNGRWGEREQTYMAFVKGDNYPARLGYVRRVFGAPGKSYHRLEDTFNPDTYSMATFSDAIAPESIAFRTMGLVQLTFICRPERFLRTGEQTITTASSVTLANPTGMPARPLLRVYGTGAGTLTVGNNIISITAINQYVDIDCEMMDCFKGSTNCNADVTLASFPEFKEGTTGVSITGGLTSVEITPRWWSL